MAFHILSLGGCWRGLVLHCPAVWPWMSLSRLLTSSTRLIVLSWRVAVRIRPMVCEALSAVLSSWLVGRVGLVPLVVLCWKYLFNFSFLFPLFISIAVVVLSLSFSRLSLLGPFRFYNSFLHLFLVELLKREACNFTWHFFTSSAYCKLTFDLIDLVKWLVPRTFFIKTTYN